MSSTRRTALVLLLCALCAVLAPSAAEQREGHSGHSDSLHPGGSGSAQRFHRFRAQPPQPSAGDSKDAGSGEAKPPAFRFPWEDETDLYGDYDLDKVRDKDTLTLDARDLAPAKPEPQHKRSIMDDFPEFPMRVPVEITPGLSDLIEQQGVYFWNPSNREKGNLNHAGWDKIEAPAGGPIKLKPRGKEPASIPPFDVERPADADPLPPRSPPSNPDDDEMLKKLGSKKGQHIILSPSKLPPPTRDWILTRFAGDGGKALHCHSLDETRAYLNFKGVDKDLPTGVKLFVTAYRNVEGIKRKVKRNDFMEALRRVKEAQNKKVEIPKFRDFLARLAKRLGMDPRPFQRKEHSEESESVGALLKAMAESTSGRARGRRGRESSESSRSRSSRSSESSRSRSSRSESVRRILSQLSELSRAESSRRSEESSEEGSSLSLFSHRSASSAARRLLSLGTVMLEVAEPGDLEISSSLQSLLTDGWELDKNYNVKGDSSQRVMDADKAKGNEMSENAEAAGENSNATMANAEGESADWSEIFKRASALDQELNKKLKLKSARAVKAEESSEEGQGTRRPPPTDLTQYPEGFYYFWMHGKPNNYGNPKSCYDPLLPYEKSIDMVGPDSQEVRWGCTPFRIMAIDLQEAVKCAIDAVGLDTWQEIEPDLIHHLSFEAMRRSPKDFKLLYQRKIAYLDEIEARARMRGVNLQLPNDTSSILAECFRDEQRPLQCAPSLQGSVGMMGHGLWDHGDEWIDNAYRNIKDCHVPEGCARLVSERLMHFNLKVHQRSIPEFNNVTVPDWQRQCRMGGDPVLSDNHGDTAWYNSVTSGNDLLTASCMYSGLKQLCMELPECCPNIAVHLACKRDPKSKRCDDICIDRSGVKLARKIKK